MRANPKRLARDTAAYNHRHRHLPGFATAPYTVHYHPHQRKWVILGSNGHIWPSLWAPVGFTTEAEAKEVWGRLPRPANHQGISAPDMRLPP